MKYAIIDIDGTIADDRHRKYLLDGTQEGYDAYHNMLMADRPMNPGILNLCSSMGVRVAFVTSRPVDYSPATRAWLNREWAMADYDLYMRPSLDKRPSPELKLAIVKYHMANHDIVCAFDDRADVLEAYRGFGIDVVHVGYDGMQEYCGPAQTQPEPQEVPSSIPELLRAGAKTFEERNATYGDTYEMFGKVMATLFPEGLTIKAGDVNHFNLLGVYVQVITKAARYAAALAKGKGHIDSAHDGMVYGGMLEYLTRKLLSK